MSTPKTPTSHVKVSRITVPERCHPAVKIVFAEMKRQRITYDEMETRAGVLKSTFKAWRTHNKPGLETMQAALGALGWSFLPVPSAENVPETVRAKLKELAAEWGDLDSLLCQLMASVAHLPSIPKIESEKPKPGVKARLKASSIKLAA